MHLGVIPDGNRRYADNEGIENAEAYREAKNVIKQIGRNLKDEDVEEVSFYLLSEENLKRDDEELEDLFKLLESTISEVAEEFGDRGFRFNWATTMPDALPDHLQQKLSDLEEQFSEGKKQINALISYDGKSDILQASESIAEEEDGFTEENMASSLELDSSIDFVIRTGDNPERECLSGFPIWNASYSEFYHIKKNFPAVELEDVKEALEHYQKLRRKKGR
ncbi:hypothetical protein GKQ38_02275 [Candidatus Nanohaloarchaea archaeon]|nr:hypothetical protein GKQ38_02275 [Candidatus Nanohaloarchaea archaeon]